MATWAERYPHPGQPPKEPGPVVRPEDGFTPWVEWAQATSRWNAYVIAQRMHDMARALDSMIARGATQDRDLAVMTISIMVLDGSLPLSTEAREPYKLWKL